MKKWLVLVLAIGVCVASIVFYANSGEEEITSNHVCRICGSYRRTHTVDGVTTVEMLPSRAFLDLLGEDHAHDLAFDYSNAKKRDGFQNTLSHGDGFPQHSGRMPNAFTREYNERAEVRELVQAQIEADVLSRDLVREIVLLADLKGTSVAAAKARAMIR